MPSSGASARWCCPGAFDAISARLIKRAGFKAYFTGGFPTIGARWGLPDIGLVALGEISAAVTDIVAASDLPVMVDGDNGYGDVKNVVHVLHTYERLGVSRDHVRGPGRAQALRPHRRQGRDPGRRDGGQDPRGRGGEEARHLHPRPHRRARRARPRRGVPPRRALSGGRRRRHLHRVAARRGRARADRPKVRRAADGEHAGRRPHADPDAGRARRAWASRSRSTASRC